MKKHGEKKNRLKTTKIITGITTASIMVNPSCSSNDDLYQKEVITNEAELGEVIVPLSIKLKPDDAEYMFAIQKLSNDIISNKEIAKKYVNNPTDVLRYYGYHGLVKDDDYLLKIVLAFGDDEINKAINNKDIALYLKLCEEKGILEDNGRSIFDDDFYQKQKISLENYLNPKNSQRSIYQQESIDPGEGGLFAVAALAVVVVAGVGVLATVGAVFTTYVIAGHETYVYSTRSISQESDVLGSIYMLKSEDKNYYLLLDEEKSKIIDATIAYIKEKNPKYFETNSEETLRNIIRYNMNR